MAYVLVFLSSILFGYWATRINPKTNRGLVFLCSLISILIPSILAGLRDVSLGTDVELYLVPHFETALHTETFSHYMSLIWQKETGYMLLVFLVAKIFGNIQWLLFFIEFIIILCVYIGAWKLRKQISLPLVLLVYYLIFYNDTYNLLRQAIAMAIVFMAVNWLFEKKYVKYLIFVFIAATFHTTAVMGLIVFVVYYFLEGERFRSDISAKTMRGYVLLVCVISGCILLPNIVNALVNMGVLHSRYLMYFVRESVSNNLSNTLLYLVEIILVMCFAKVVQNEDSKFVFLKINLYFTFITLQLSQVMYFGYRMSLYFAIINVLLFARITRVSESKKTNILISIFVIGLLSVFWYYLYIVGGVSNTYPYLTYWDA
ncbi:MAG: EpsG family protein [Ruminococcaceae bacterium]|nr:EpsG family protein [Oscillospiraceae bacterium]